MIRPRSLNLVSSGGGSGANNSGSGSGSGSEGNAAGGGSVRTFVPFSSSLSSSSPSSLATTNYYISLENFLSMLTSRLSARRFLVVVSVIGIWFCAILMLANPGPPLSEHKSPIHTSRELTVVINTFKRPHKVVQDSIEFYAQCEIVKHVYVIWSESQPPPLKLTSKYGNWKTPTVQFQREATGSLNNRFKPLQGPHTTGIFSIDDDVRVPCDDLALGFEVWRGSQRSLVGYIPRVHIRSKASGLVYRCWWRVWWHGVYSIILTKAAFLHHDFFEMYTNDMPKSIRLLVDESRNCEDLAMQFLMANSTGLPPIYVKGHLTDLGVLNGISTTKSAVTAGHMDGRSKCLNSLAAVYGKVPLVVSHTIVDSAANGWTNRPSTWFEYISSDLWKI
jgi:hypothetical protein